MPEATSTVSDIYPCLTYEDAPSAIEWLCRAFGFSARLMVPGPDNTIIHSELSLGTGVVMVSSVKPESDRQSPRNLEGINQALSVYVKNPDSHYKQAKSAGALIVQELRDEDYGSRGYMAKDPEGHLWYFGDYRPGVHWDQPGDF